MIGWIASAVGLLTSAAAPAISSNVAMTLGTSTSATPPAHASGDYMFAFAYRDGNNNTPTLPAGWTALSPTGLVGANTNTGLLAYKVCASGSETCSGFTNATGVICAVVKAAGAGPLGLGADSNVTYGSASDLPATGFSLASGDGHSVVLFFGGQRNTGGDQTQVPAGMTYGIGGLGSSCKIGGAYTTTGVAAFPGGTAAWGMVSSGYASATVEITGAA